MRIATLGVMAALATACGPATDELAAVPACKAWMDALARCEAAAPVAMRPTLKALAETVRHANRNPPDNTRLSEGCEAAAANLRKDALALCPDVTWSPP